MTSVTFDWFGTGMCVESNSRSLPRYLGRIVPPPHPNQAPSLRLHYDLAIHPGKGRSLKRGRATHPLDRRAPIAHAARMLLEDLMARSGSLFLLHGAALAREGRALIVSAPSGFGKTTLAVHLGERGFDLLTDDLVGVDRATGVVLPFPRYLGLRPGTRRLLTTRLRARARAARRFTARDGSWSVDPLALFGKRPAPAAPSVVVVVRPTGPRTGLRRLPVVDLRFAKHAGPPPDSLRSLAGVEDVRTHTRIPGVVRVRYSEAHELGRFLERHRRRIVVARKRPVNGPRFDRSPAIWSIGPFQAAVELAQEMTNRGYGSRIEREFRGREGELVLAIASLIGRSRCYAMTPGRLKETLALLEHRFEADRP